MRTFKKKMLRIFFLIEICVFVSVYVMGPNGLQKMLVLEDENRKIESVLEQLKTDVLAWEQRIMSWEADDFYKEKVAREHLQMARDKDEIFYIKKA